MAANLENSAVDTGLGLVSFHSRLKEGQCQRIFKLQYISHTSKVMLKILYSRLQEYMNQELPDVQARLRKDRGIRDQIAKIWQVIEKAREFQEKTSTSALLTTLKPLTVWITTNCGNLLKRWGYQTILPVSSETCILRNL